MACVMHAEAGPLVNLQQMANSSYVHRYSSTDGRFRLVKILLGTYPVALHTELADKGLMLKLLEKPVQYPGGYTVVESTWTQQTGGQAFRASVIRPILAKFSECSIVLSLCCRNV